MSKEKLKRVLNLDEMDGDMIAGIKRDWKAFFREPEKYVGTPVIAMVNQYLHDLEYTK